MPLSSTEVVKTSSPSNWLGQLLYELKTEPAVVAGAVNAIVALLAAFVFSASPTAEAAVVTIVTAASAIYVAAMARPIQLPLITGGIATALTAAAVFGLNISPDQMGLLTTAVATVLGLLLRGQLTPVASLRVALTVVARGLDYAWAAVPPSPLKLEAAGAHFILRYLSSDPSKNLTLAEKNAALADGLHIGLVWEQAANRALSGYAAGVADAKAAQAELGPLGMASSVVYFAVDFDATPAQQAAINAYLNGAASVLGKSRTGVYGGYYVVSRALNAGVVKYAWQTFAWSGGQWDARAQLRQVTNGVTVAGQSCDWDNAVAADWGQWPRPGSPTPPPAPAPAGSVTWSQWPSTVTLIQGMNDPTAVKVLQTACANSGIVGVRGITVDGNFGPQTETAVRNFQAHTWGASSTRVDGIAGPLTRGALQALNDL